MKGVARSFWVVVAVVIAAEAFIAVLAVRSVESDLTCWVSGVSDNPYSCGYPVAIVGHQNWIPALAALILCAATVLVGCGTFVTQYVRTRRALRRLGAALPSPPVLLQIAAMLSIEVELCADERCFCCSAGLLFPKVIISTGMYELLDEAQLTAVLAHEAAHVCHRDPARALAVRCASNALFYLPLARYLSRKALVASELGADSAAASVAGQPALVRALLEVLGRLRPGLGTVTEMASLDALDSRIEALQTKAFPRSRPKLAIQGSTVFALVGLILLGVWLPRSPHGLHVLPAHSVVHVLPAHSVVPVKPKVRDLPISP
jgi:beta-lactamase regulating signal transducer with metallopeptidase domain